LGNQIELLVSLQTIDRRLRERTEAIDVLEKQLEDIESQLAEKRSELDACQAERAQVDARRREIEALLADEESKTKDRRMRLNRIRNEKEASAVRREIELGKEESQRLEEELIAETGIYAVLKTLTARETELQEAFDGLGARRTAERTRADAEIGALSVGLDEERARRAEVASTIDPSLRQRYEGIFERKRGLAVVEIRSGNCEGCHMRVAPQLANEIQRSQRVITCPSCHRILFWRAESTGDEA
jgi:uncharacterized protein